MSGRYYAHHFEHLIHLPVRPLTVSMNWRWNDAALVFWQEQDFARYPRHLRGQTIDRFTSKFTAVLGELHVPFADGETLVALLADWIESRGHSAAIEIHCDLPAASSRTPEELERVLQARYGDRAKVVARARRATRRTVYEAIERRFFRPKHELDTLVHPRHAAGLAAELATYLDPLRQDLGLRPGRGHPTPFLDALSPCIEHQFVGGTGVRDVRGQLRNASPPEAEFDSGVHVQVFWPDGSPTGRLLPMGESRQVAEAPGPDGRSERLFVLERDSGDTRLVVRRIGSESPTGTAERDDEFDPGTVATVLTVPQAVLWFSDRKLLVPASLRAEAQRFDTQWKLFRARPELPQLLEVFASAPARIHAEGYAIDDIRVLCDLGLVMPVRVDDHASYRHTGFVRQSNVSALVDWIDTQVKKMRRTGACRTELSPQRTRLSKAEVRSRMDYVLKAIRKDPSLTLKWLSKQYQVPANTLKKSAELKECRRDAKARRRRAAPSRPSEHRDEDPIDPE